MALTSRCISTQFPLTHFNGALQSLFLLQKWLKNVDGIVKNSLLNLATMTWTYLLRKVKFISTTFRELVAQDLWDRGLFRQYVYAFRTFFFSILIKKVGIGLEWSALVRNFSIMRTLSKTTNFAVSHTIILEILASINCEITERGKYYGVRKWCTLFHISFIIKIISEKNRRKLFLSEAWRAVELRQFAHYF